MIVSTIVILIMAVLIEIQARPRLDKTRDGKLLLWYGKNQRKFIEL